MARQSSHIVIYQDSPKSPRMYFGPFVSIDMASEFSKELPLPLEGGFKKYAITQPFTHSETKIVNDLIMISREKLKVSA